MSNQADVTVFLNSGPSTLQVSYKAAGVAYDLTGLTPKLSIGSSLSDLDLESNAPVVLTGSISGPAADGVALFSLTAANTATLGPGRFYCQAEATDENTVNHKAAPFTLEIARGVRNLPPDES